MKIRLLIAEDEAVAPAVLDFVEELRASGFGYDIEPVVALNITEAYVAIGECDIAIIDIGENKRLNLALVGLVKYNIPMVVTSALLEHQRIKDHEGFGFLSKPKFDLEKLRRKLKEFAELIANSDGEKAFAI